MSIQQLEMVRKANQNNTAQILPVSNTERFNPVVRLMCDLQQCLDPDELWQVFSREVKKRFSVRVMFVRHGKTTLGFPASANPNFIKVHDVIVRGDKVGYIEYWFANKPTQNLCKVLAELSEVFCSCYASAIQFQELKKISIQDALTGLCNRRHFNNSIQNLFSHNQRQSAPFGLMLCDLDHFKKVNDTYGHHIGDLILKEFASVLKACVRKTDLVFRLGGDEFSIVISDGKKDSAAMLCQRIEAACEKNPLMAEYGVGTSMGFAFYRSDDTSKTLFERADEALYSNKNSRKQRLATA